MPATLRALVESPHLGLRLLTPPADPLDAAVEWVHSSDLVDPTPFLGAGQVLLTTGTQFPDGGSFFDDYVGRLRDHGVVGLGFGTDVVREGTPTALIDACLRRDLPLVEVPYRTPFIAVVQEVAGILARETYARQTWAAAAQSAITRAALRPDGLSATLSELSRQLGSWVALYDATGELDRSFSPGTAFDPEPEVVERAVRTLLTRRRRASGTVEGAGGSVTLQTLGSGGRLSGVLAIGGDSPLDRASTGLVESVIALAGLALQQNRDLNRARSHLRTGLLHALLAGDHALAEGTAREMWGALPTDPLRVAATTVRDDTRDAVTDLLELRVERDPEALFFAHQDDLLILCLGSRGRELPEELAGRFGIAVGVSDEASWAGLSTAVAQASRAQDRAAASGAGVAGFADVTRGGVLALLSGGDARTIAGGILAPIDARDAGSGTDLRRTLRVWLESDGRYGVAARALGVHRHTVRNRIAAVEDLLHRDLSAFSERADLWAALLATAEP